MRTIRWFVLLAVLIAALSPVLITAQSENTTLFQKAALSLDSGGKVAEITSEVTLDALTESITLTIDRPGDLTPSVVWDRATTISTEISIKVDGEVFSAKGQASGGVRTSPGGVNGVPYKLSFTLPHGYFGARSGDAKRIGQIAQSSFVAYIKIGLIRGSSVSTSYAVSAVKSEALTVPFKNSVSYNTSDATNETTGDGVVNLSMGSSGSDRAMFAGVGGRANSGVMAGGSATYGGSGMTEIWDAVGLSSAATFSSAGYYVVAPSTSSTEVVSTLAAADFYDHYLALVAFEGVDQSTPVGTPQTATGDASPATVTITDAAADDMMVDMMGADASTATVGADQTSQEAWDTTYPSRFRTSTQPGNAADDIMSWTVATSWVTGAVAFNAVSASVEQEGFRFRNDDGSETTATWYAAQDSNATAALATPLRLRLLINATDDPSSAAYTLYYKKSTDSVYTAVSATTTTDFTPTLTTDEGTESGNNTASGSWAVSYPDAAAGDLIIIGISWDDSTTVTDVTEPAGPDSEVLSEINATPSACSNTACRSKVWYTIATDAWTASTLTFTPSADEQWTAAVVVIPAGEFDATTPIGANTTDTSAGVTDTDILNPAFSAGSSDGGGRLFVWTAANQDPQSLAADWTQIANQDRGIVSGGFFTRDAAVSDSESIAEDTVSTIVGDDWSSVSFVVRGNTVTHPIYILASANITAGGEDTTFQLAAPSGKSTSDFDTGRMWDNENGSDSLDITADDYTEVEWSIQSQSPAVNGDVYTFRVYAGSSPLATYTVTAQLTLSSGVATQCRGTLLGVGC